MRNLMRGRLLVLNKKENGGADLRLAATIVNDLICVGWTNGQLLSNEVDTSCS